MWDSKTTDYDIMSTPFGRDMTKELAEACKKHGLRFSLYYSNPDWYNPDWWCPAAGGPGYKLKPEEYGKDNYEFSNWWGRVHVPKGQKPNKQRYVKYMTKQVEELLTNYGDISLMWWDGSNPGAFGQIWVNEQEKIGRDLEKLSRKWQPAMVQNNRLGWDRTKAGYTGGWFSDAFGDYNSTETGLSTVDVNKPWELTWTLGTQWSWKPNDIYKTKKNQIREYLLKAVGQNGNYLMDVSPDSSGAFEPRVVKRITEIGNWLKLYAESIYETRGGPYMPQVPNAVTWGYSTRKDNKVYLHILNWPADNQLTFPSLGKKIVKSKLLTGGNVNVTQANATSPITIEAPSYYQKEIDTIIELKLSKDVMDLEPVEVLDPVAISTGKTVTVSGEWVGREKELSKNQANDGNFGTIWAGPENSRNGWVEIDLGADHEIVMAIVDDRPYYRIQKFKLQAKVGDQWKTLTTGTTIGNRKKLNFEKITARVFRLQIEEANEVPTIAEFQLFE